MNKLIEQIDKLINKQGSLKTPAYYIRGLFIDIVSYFEKKINSFNGTINNINKKINDISKIYLSKEEGLNIKTDIDNDITNLNSSLISQITSVNEIANYSIQLINYLAKYITLSTSSSKEISEQDFIYSATTTLASGNNINFRPDIYLHTLIPINGSWYLEGSNDISGDFGSFNNDELIKSIATYGQFNNENVSQWCHKNIIIKYKPAIGNYSNYIEVKFKFEAFIYLILNDKYGIPIYIIDEARFEFKRKLNYTSLGSLNSITIDPSSKAYDIVANRFNFYFNGEKLDFSQNNKVNVNSTGDNILKIKSRLYDY